MDPVQEELADSFANAIMRLSLEGQDDVPNYSVADRFVHPQAASLA